MDNASGLDDARWRSLLDHLWGWRSLLDQPTWLVEQGEGRARRRDHFTHSRGLDDARWRSLLDQLWDWRSLLDQPARRS